MYEKMKEEKPGFNEPTDINQPEPNVVGNKVTSEIDTNRPVSKTPEQEAKEYDEQLKRKLLEAAKTKGKNVSQLDTPVKNKTNLEKRIAYLEEAVKLLMDQQMKILRENG
jgi:hypothetical protein